MYGWMTVGSDGGSLTSIVLNCSSWLVVSLHKANVTTAPRVNKQHLTWLGGPAIPRLNIRSCQSFLFQVDGLLVGRCSSWGVAQVWWSQ